jgi:type II/III secretion system protein
MSRFRFRRTDVGAPLKILITWGATAALLVFATAASPGVAGSLPPSRQATARPGPAAPGDSAPGAVVATRVFNIRYRSVDEVYMMISPVLGPHGSIRAEPHQRTITVVDAPGTLDTIARTIAAYDVPPRSVEVAIQLIMASSSPVPPAPAPPTIRGVIDKLTALSTRWNDYRMVGDARVLGTEGERSSLRVGDDYKVDFRIEQVSEESRTIRFKPFELQKREPAVEGGERFGSVMSTVLNLRDSQLFIVGASRMERSNRALFMTITASLPQP